MVKNKTRYIPLIFGTVTSPAVEQCHRQDISTRTQCHAVNTDMPLSNPYTSCQTPTTARELLFGWEPTPGKVAFLPDETLVPHDSIVRAQKRQRGFFQHPILVTSVDSRYAYFYALTSRPPRAIGELGMCLLLGRNTKDEGPRVLRLADNSERMAGETWVNLEQQFKIEREVLLPWTTNVNIAPSEKYKVEGLVNFLESQQNRYLYKPLERDLSGVRPGTVLMMPNSPGTSTFGAPILVLENNYPGMRYLRIKLVKDNQAFREPLDEQARRARQHCLAIKKDLTFGHDGTPVILLDKHSQNMREPSYIEVCKKPKFGHLPRCKTWCFPPVQIAEHSMVILFDYMAQLPDMDNGLAQYRGMRHCPQPAYLYPYPHQHQHAHWTPYHPYAHQQHVWDDASYGQHRVPMHSHGFPNMGYVKQQRTISGASSTTIGSNHAHYMHQQEQLTNMGYVERPHTTSSSSSTLIGLHDTHEAYEHEQRIRADSATSQRLIIPPTPMLAPLDEDELTEYMDRLVLSPAPMLESSDGDENREEMNV